MVIISFSPSTVFSIFQLVMIKSLSFSVFLFFRKTAYFPFFYYNYTILYK
nr:MAG TPA: hypothetical protein [Caudoviricetes sp.]